MAVMARRIEYQDMDEVGPAESYRQGLSRCGDGGRAMRIEDGRDGGANKRQTKEVFRGSHY